MAGVKGRSGRKKLPELHRIEQWRAKIQTEKIVNRLTEHVVGDNKMDSTQVSAALGLLKKTLPDITEQRGSGEQGEHVHKLIVEFGGTKG